MVMDLGNLGKKKSTELPFEASVMFQLKDLKQEGYTNFEYEEEKAGMNGKRGKLLKVVMYKRGHKMQTKPIFVSDKKDYKEVKKVLKKCIKCF